MLILEASHHIEFKFKTSDAYKTALDAFFPHSKYKRPHQTNCRRPW